MKENKNVYKINNKKKIIPIVLFIGLAILIILGFVAYSYINNSQTNLTKISEKVTSKITGVYNSVTKIVGFSVQEQEATTEETAEETEPPAETSPEQTMEQTTKLIFLF